MNLRIIGLWVTGLTTGIFLMVVDEVLSLALYCGPMCRYWFPVLGAFGLWESWELAFASLVLSSLASLVLIGEKQRASVA
jgi:hypothetical protein